MLTKILITALVMFVAFGVQRFRARRNVEIPVVRVQRPVPAARPMPGWVRPAAWVFVAGVVTASALWYYSSWQDNQRIVTIRVISPGGGDVATYRAHKGSIDGRTFSTTDGLTVRIADSDRVEVIVDN